jgi:signal peptidase I
MHDIRLSGSTFTGIMCAVLEKGASFRFRATGHSMSPFIRNGDVLTVARAGYDTIQVGDVVVVRDPARRSALIHRAIKKQASGILLKGDNCRTADGIFPGHAVIGRISTIERGRKTIRCHKRPYKNIIAFMSASGVLNTFVLPLLRTAKKLATLQREQAGA